MLLEDLFNLRGQGIPDINAAIRRPARNINSIRAEAGLGPVGAGLEILRAVSAHNLEHPQVYQLHGIVSRVGQNLGAIFKQTKISIVRLFLNPKTEEKIDLEKD